MVAVGARLARLAAGAVCMNVWLALLGLATTPYLFLGLGPAAYGVFAMVSVVSGQLANLELGFGHATVRYLAKARAGGDHEGERAILDTSFSVFVVTGVLAALIFFTGAHYLVFSFFQIPHPLQTDALIAFQLGAVIVGLSFVTSCFSSTLQGFERFDWLNWSRTLLGSLAAISAVGAVSHGGGLVSVLVTQLVVSVVSIVILGIAVVRIHGEAVCFRVDWRLLREMRGFGFFLFLAGIAYQWMVSGPLVVLSANVSASEVPAFSIPHNILQKLTILVTSASLAFFPFASARALSGQRSIVSAVFLSYIRLTVLVMGPVVAYLAVFAESLLEVWVSREFAIIGAPCLRLLAGGALVLALSSPPADVARGLGRPGWVFAYTSTVAFLGLGASVVLIPRYGVVGAALALFGSITCGALVFLWTVARRLLALTGKDIVAGLAAPLAAVFSVTVLYMVGSMLASGLPGALITGCLATAAYAGGVFCWILKPGERAAIRGIAVQA